MAAAQKAPAGRDALLSTKLHAPGPRPGFVPRPRLTERLDEALGRGVVLVCAPAGYGKTALLAGWAQRCQPPVAWLSVDAGDNDPARFWRHAVAALDQVCPGIGERVGPLLGPPPPPSFEGLVTALINELAARPVPARCRWCSMTITWSPPSRCMCRWVSCSSTYRLGCIPCWPAAPTRRWPWRGCAPAASSPSCATPTCGSRPTRQRTCCVKQPAPTCPTRR